MNQRSDEPARTSTAPWSDLVDWSRDTVVVDLSMPPSPERARQIEGQVARYLQPTGGPDLERTLATVVDQYADLILLSPPDPRLRDLRANVAALKRILRSGGRVLIEFPVEPSDRDSKPYPPPEIDWRQALEAERIWIDEDQRYTPIFGVTECSDQEPMAHPFNQQEKGALKMHPCYRRLSGIK